MTIFGERVKNLTALYQTAAVIPIIEAAASHASWAELYLVACQEGKADSAIVSICSYYNATPPKASAVLAVGFINALSYTSSILAQSIAGAKGSSSKV